ncbi:MAG TPA: diguanylate cyclase [Steroidobacteraceae bacterium]
MASSPSSLPSVDVHADDCATIKPSILLVDDEMTARLMMARQLTRAGYEVEAVANGAQALEMFKKRFFPMLLTDWDMPEINGVTLCKALREAPLEGYVYTILLTARGGKENMIEGLAAGADDYMIKPPDDSELRARLNTGRRILRLEKSLRAANDRILTLSNTDALTGVFNRRYLMERLPKELGQSARYSRPLAIVLCDLDHFKNINDTRGHQAGDAVLKSFGQLLKSSVRGGSDWVARYGGEEFLIVLPDTPATNALIFTERLRATIEAHPFQIPTDTLRLSASFGVACFDLSRTRADISIDQLIGCADVGLYHSKESGRNRVTCKSIEPDDL